ncbi:MAG: glycine cleavage system protein GcvH [Clostridiaceae bacterium]|jgi:glycine cleavage system H protein|nr:glycine cleavage system protein GcvH [Clostridiaceae bacterium]
MKTVEGLKYSKEHEWVKVDGNKAYIGITDHAQNSLGEIVFVELPETGAELNSGDVLGVVESVKAASDVYTPVSGVVAEVNEELEESPEKINEAPYESWIAVLELSDLSELDKLLDAGEYEKYCKEEA